MYDDIDLLVQPYLQKKLSDCSVHELKSITDKYPYFAPAQLALLKKLKTESVPQYDTQLQKAVLYYYDPVQFEAFVNSEKFITDIDFVLQASEEPIEEVTPVIEAPPIEKGTTDEVGDTAEPEIKTPDEEITSADEAGNIYADDILTITPDKEDIVEEVKVTEEITPAPLPLPVETKEAELAFEPYHTVDYFASQGIKLSQEEASNDKVGKQLKSFTAWLKTMKKLPQPELSGTLETTYDHKVQNLAEHSLENTDIVTETMAEVWIKQGNRQKAIEVYNKLSLQNPSKKAYFAAKIENLKKAS